ncbi:phosphodiester glycosidase family protein [Crossiella sp. CA198]|uniref:phosphodiester glycosidase family protein n=1 Tax=Crossiella sp. CA198 TaxID=3455607 RepID=UPI003F8D7307
MRTLRATVALLSVLALTAAVPAPALAERHGVTAPLGPRPIEDAPAASAADGAVATLATAAPRVDALPVSEVTSPVAPGLDLTEFDRLDARGWIRGDVLTADLGRGTLRPAYLSPGVVAARSPLSEQAAARGVVAGVNGDFFDINATGAPLGVGMDAGALRHAPAAGHNLTAAIGPADLGRLAEVFLDATITLPGGIRLTGTNLNSPVVAANGVGVFTALWGHASRRTAIGTAVKATEVELRDGVVTAVRPAPGEGPIPANTAYLLGIDAGADRLAGLVPGQRVEVAYQPRTDGPVPLAAVGGNRVLVRDGVVQNLDDTTMHPRTAVGFSADGRRLWMVTVDGRQADSRGMTERELAELLRSFGADDALNLDGGGSSTLLARRPGDSAAGVHNQPSDGGERLVPNGIGLTANRGSGRLTAFRVEPAVRAGAADRVLAGQTRVVTAHGHDETGAPVPGEPTWRVAPTRAGKVSRGVFHASTSGKATVTASRGSARGSTTFTVLGKATRIDSDTERVSLSGLGARGRFQILGQDAEGFSTWLEPADVTLEYDQRVVQISKDRNGFVAAAVAGSGATVVKAKVGDLTTHLGVTVGVSPRVVSTMDDLTGWRTSVFPAVVGAAISLVPGRNGGKAIGLDYRLTGTTATRAAYLNAEPPAVLPPGTQRLGVWAHGDNNKAWLRMTLLDAAGTPTVVDLARQVDWTGWRYVEAPIPAALTGQLRLQRLYLVETDRERQYEGKIAFAELTAQAAVPITVPGDPAAQDPAIIRTGTLEPRPGAVRVAVVSDAQFTADAPEGPLVAQARRTLREALAARPDVLLINGDLVDRALPADMALARQILDSELGDRVPWFYLPGNHETYGPGDTSEFRKHFGATHRVVDKNGLRLILLDSALGSLRAGGFDQVRALRTALDTAATDPNVKSVLVAMHHPVDDPTPAAASELSDAKEATLLTTWLAEFRARSGKPAVSVAAHAGLFHATRRDGVPYLINGNSGKAPAAAPADGGFTGWTLLRVDPAAGNPVQAEQRPHVDGLTLDIPATLAPGAGHRLTPTVRQGIRTFPIGYPIAATYTATDALHLGPPATAAPAHIAAFDPATGVLTALRPGTATLTLAVSNTATSAPVTVR